MSLKIKKIDIILTIIILIATVSALVVFLVQSKPSDKAAVYIYVDSNLVEECPYSLKENRIIILKKEKYSVLLADLTVEIKNSKVAVTYEESPKNICSNMGFTGLVNYPIVCLPNKTMVIIRNGSAVYRV